MNFIYTVCALLSIVRADVLSDYVAKPDENFDWFEYTNLTFTTNWGNTGRVLNVTTLKWMDETKAAGPRGAIWDHEVIVVIPKDLEFTHIATVTMFGSCNGKPGAAIDKNNNNILKIDELAHNSKTIAVGILQIPNCPIVYPSDPEQRPRHEDEILAWAWKEFLDDPNHDPEWMPRLPMVKALFQVMRAVQEFTVQEGIADIEGWITSGESKRGWTTALSGAVKCDTCAAKIVAIAPKVPIMPNIIEDIHYQWQSYNGFTFEFADYIDANITTRIDTPEFAQAMKYVDAINYIDEMADIPKFFIVSSSDEFAQIEWTNAYYDKFKGEMELFIVPNTEHHLNTDGGFDLVYSSLGQFVRSIAKGEEKRPTFDYEVNKESGEISVTIPKDQAQPEKVELRYAESMSNKMKDFRAFVMADADGQCKFPLLPVSTPHAEIAKQTYKLGNGETICQQAIPWLSLELYKDEETSDGDAIYSTKAPEPKETYWMGYYIEITFPGDGSLNQIVTTPGFVYPDTLPFADCHGDECVGRKV